MIEIKDKIKYCRFRTLRIHIPVVILLFLVQFPASSQYYGFYSININSRELVFIDTTGNILPLMGINAAPFDHTGLAADKFGILWWLNWDPNNAINQLYRIDLCSGDFNFITNLYYADGSYVRWSGDIDFDNHGVLYFYQEKPNYEVGELLTVNQTTGICTPVAATQNASDVSIMAILFNKDYTYLWTGSESSDRLSRMDYNNGVITWTASNGYGYNFITGLAYSPTGELWGMDIDRQPPRVTNFFSIDTVTGGSTFKFRFPQPFTGFEAARLPEGNSDVKILSDKKPSICLGDTLKLFTSGKYKQYVWSTSETSDTILACQMGTYAVHVIDSLGRHSCASIKVIVNGLPYPRIVISGKNKLCAGDSAVLFTRQSHESYLWSTGDTTAKIVVKAPGTYSVTVVDSNGCQGVDKVEILPGDIAAPEISISGGVPCFDDSVILRAKGHYYSYEWIDSISGEVISRTDSVVIGKSGKYYLRVGDSAGCSAVSGTEEIILGPSNDVLEIITPSGGNLVRFDSSALGKISCLEVIVRNKGMSAYSLRSVRLSGNVFFSVPLGQFPLEIPPGEMKELLICFSSRDTSYHKDSVYIDDLCSTHIIGLGGSGVRNILDGNTRCGTPVSIESFSTGLQGIEFSEPYPNPASDILFIGLKHGKEELRPQEEVVVNVKIFNSIGEACFDRHYEIYPSSIGKDDPGSELKLGLAGLEPGYYFLRIMAGGRIWSRPVLIWR